MCMNTKNRNSRVFFNRKMHSWKNNARRNDSQTGKRWFIIFRGTSSFNTNYNLYDAPEKVRPQLLFV